MNSLNLQSSSKTDQIMSRYRPIAPKPHIPTNPSLHGPSAPEKTHQSPLFNHLQLQKPRSSRARKRGKSGISPAIHKGGKTHFPKCGVASLAKNNQGFGHGLTQFPLPNPAFCGSLEKPVKFVTLPFLPYPSSSAREMNSFNPYSQLKEVSNAEIPQEKDLLKTLKAPASCPPSSCCKNIITPQPMRPIGSSISVACIRELPSSYSIACISKKPEEVEAEVELDALPVVVSDFNNKVRLVNSAYKVMVGQPECMWLDSMATCDRHLRGSVACKRINGEVMLDLSDSQVPVSSNGFSCKVKIEWGSNGKKSSINAPCDVRKLSCESKNYLFIWKFHTSEVSQV